MQPQNYSITAPIDLQHSYADLPERFYARVSPEPAPKPERIALNEALAKELGIDPDWLASEDGLAFLSGAGVAEGSSPLAQAYAGHQFGNWVPQLGDGRAVLLGEVVKDGRRRDIQLKGSGRTPFSRSGDGKAWLGPVLREYVVAEAMAALGVPTTRALAAISTGEPVYRESELPGALLVRTAASHIRVGTFQFFTARQDIDGLRLLADHAIERHHPKARQAANPYLALLEAVIEAQVALVAHWQSLGFIHGVMNTDNVTISGETIDYGPCAFIDTYHPDTVFSSIDRGGRYRYNNQPVVAQWNLAVFASALLPLLGEDREAATAEAQALIDSVPGRMDAAIGARMGAKLGLETMEEGDGELAASLLSRMAANLADFTNTFRALCALPAEGAPQTDGPARSQFADPTAFDDWARDWRERLAHETRSDAERQAAMRGVNPAFIARNHRVEEIIRAALDGDFSPFHRLNAVLADPFSDQPENEAYRNPPRDEERVTATFCGT